VSGANAPKPAEDGVRFRTLSLDDGRTVFGLVQESGVLEANSAYAYLLLCSDFGDAGVIAEDSNGDALGFVVGYRPPTRPTTMFVWQVGVHSAARGRGIGGRLLDALFRLNPDATHLEATVAPSNEASKRLFTAFARCWGAPCEVGEGFVPAHFPGANHEAEERYRIGPVERNESS